MIVHMLGAAAAAAIVGVNSGRGWINTAAWLLFVMALSAALVLIAREREYGDR